MPQRSNTTPKRKPAAGKAQPGDSALFKDSDVVETTGAAVIGAEQPGAGNRKMDDLITELREISGQVNRMMSQVDRAIHRLGVHAGEPLKR